VRTVYLGTSEFAADILARLAESPHRPELVVTRPDRPRGRGRRLASPPVADLARELELPLEQPDAVNGAQALARIATAEPEAVCVCAFGALIREPLLSAYPILNVHPSLLPRWRGAAPIQRAILAGDTRTGISIMQMDRGLDTGPILAAEAVPIAGDDTSATLHDKLAELGARLIVSVLAGLERGELSARPQEEALASYAAKVAKAEAEIDWRETALAIERKIRAFNPQPGASAATKNTAFKIWRAGTTAAEGAPGTILEAGPAGIVVACGSGALNIQELQRAGGKRLSAAQFLAGFPLAPGERLEFSPKATI
jgi:methionyl-tRNA formyltransferase